MSCGKVKAQVTLAVQEFGPTTKPAVQRDGFQLLTCKQKATARLLFGLGGVSAVDMQAEGDGEATFRVGWGSGLGRRRLSGSRFQVFPYCVV
ncbi:hypothetical protein QYF36_019110 [Acer negundo]|nr:hypothetical protein QYF36_019110 [Acer negundo]